MKRHNFRGQGASHGNHKHHRAPGCIGSCSFPGRVFKGLKMSGHMGHERVTVLNLEVVRADTETLLVSATTALVSIDTTGRLAVLPPDVRAVLEAAVLPADHGR